MKAKYIFTKFGPRRNDMEVSDIIPETDADYDAADIFQEFLYSEDGETITVEADDFEKAFERANRYFSGCLTWRKIGFSAECAEKLRDLALHTGDPMLLVRSQDLYSDPTPPYVPAAWKFPFYEKKRIRKYLGKDYVFTPNSEVYDTGKYYAKRHKITDLIY